VEIFNHYGSRRGLARTARNLLQAVAFSVHNQVAP
jgi:hypothetical protein